MAEVDTTPPDEGQDPGLDPGGLDSGPGRRVPQRTCIVTRVVQPPEAMIRFVRGPDGSVVPDLRAKLPGRGAWISARRDAVATAVRKNLFRGRRLLEGRGRDRRPARRGGPDPCGGSQSRRPSQDRRGLVPAAR